MPPRGTSSAAPPGRSTIPKRRRRGSLDAPLNTDQGEPRASQEGTYLGDEFCRDDLLARGIAPGVLHTLDRKRHLSGAPVPDLEQLRCLVCQSFAVPHIWAIGVDAHEAPAESETCEKLVAHADESAPGQRTREAPPALELIAGDLPVTAATMGREQRRQGAPCRVITRKCFCVDRTSESEGARSGKNRQSVRASS